MTEPRTGADASARPRQLILAAGVVIGASLFLVISVFDAISNLNSVDGRQQVQDLVSSSTGTQLGLTLDAALRGVRALLTVTALLATVTTVLGVFVLQRHRGSRLALSILAVPLLLTAPLTGNLLGALVAIAVSMLWRGPARDWYDGRPVRTPETPNPFARPDQRPPSSTQDQPDERTIAPYAPPASTATPPVDAPSTRTTSSAPGATQGFGGTTAPAPAVDQGPAWPAPGYPQGVPAGQPGQQPGQQPGPAAYSGWPVPVPTRVPGQVRIACSLTWVFSGIVALLYALSVIALLVDRERIVQYIVDTPAWQQSQLDSGLLVPALWVGTLMFLAWSLGAMVLAWFTWRRQNWARILLAVSAGIVLVLATVAFPVGLVHQLACAFTIGTLFSRPAREWFATQRPVPPGVPGPPQPQPQQQPQPSKPHVW